MEKLDWSDAARREYAEADALRLHREKMEQYERAMMAELENERLKAALVKLYWWINDVPSPGTRGAISRMRDISDALGFSPTRAGLAKEQRK